MKTLVNSFAKFLVAAIFIWSTELYSNDYFAEYQSFEELTKILRRHSDDERVQWSSLGKTLEKRDIWLLKISEDKDQVKPAILILGSTVSSRLTGTEIVLGIIDMLLNGQYQHLLKTTTFYFIPRPSPDASELFFNQPHWQRETNSRKIDDDKDGEINEDGPEDLNKDGQITSMRIEDPSGEWMSWSEDPRILVKARAHLGEKGRYKVIEFEGIDNDHDDLINEDGSGGVEFDKNFTFNYPYFKKGAGPHQVSERETRAIADFAFSHPNIAIVFSFGKEDNIHHPWVADEKSEKNEIKTKVLKKDERYGTAIAEQLKGLFKDAGKPEKADVTGGSFVRWAYFHFGRWSFSSAGWWAPDLNEDTGAKPEDEKENKSSPKKHRREKAEALKKVYDWFDQEKIEFFSAWTEVEHPDFKDQKVEVGGVLPFRLWNPPLKYVEESIATHTAILKNLSQMLPVLKFSKVQVEPLHEDLFRLTIHVSNEGTLPTMPEMGKVNRCPRPLQLHITFDGKAEFLTGHQRQFLAPLAGNGGSQKVTLLIRTKAQKVKLKVESPSCGTTSREVDLR